MASNQNIPGAITEKLFRDSHPSFRAAFGRYKIIDIRAAAEQFYLSCNGRDARDVFAFFEAVLPPFPECIFEFQSGDREFTVGGDEDPFAYQEAAVILTTEPLKSEEKTKLNNQFLGEDVCFSVRVTWVTSQDGEPMSFVEQPRFFIKRDGRLLLRSNALVIAGWESTDDRYFNEIAIIGIAPVLFALTLMHCRNVTLDRVTTPLPLSNKNSKRRKQIAERKKYPPFERHTIVIRDRKGRVVQTGQRLEGAAKGLHWVRGHFHRYTPDRPLFGNPKLHGRFWVPAYIAGLNAERVIESDYRLEVA